MTAGQLPGAGDRFKLPNDWCSLSMSGILTSLSWHVSMTCCERRRCALGLQFVLITATYHKCI